MSKFSPISVETHSNLQNFLSGPLANANLWFMKTPILLATALVLLTSSAFAQTFKVLKVKGNKAIIQVPKGITLDQGAKYSIDSEGSAEAPRLNENAASRQYVTGGTVELFFGSQRQESASGTASSSTTEFATDLKFGWNKGQMEYS